MLQVKKKNIFFIFLIIFFVSFFIFNIILKNSTKLLTVNTVPIANSDAKKQNICMKAVWVSYMDLNMKNTDYSEEAFKKKFNKIVDDCKKLKINSLVFHVRPFSDAVYPSKYFPWSHIVSKKQGQHPGYDPLKYMITKTHEAGMQFHAWINPFRIQLNNIPQQLCKNHPFYYFKAKKNKILNKYFVDFDKSKYYNPSSSSVQELIINGIKEIVKNYNIDGIHFDDYFYPEVEKGAENFDEENYKKYLKNFKEENTLSHKDWRFKNVNDLIKKVYKEIKIIKQNVVFGISPAGNIKNNERIGADIETWCKSKGYVDYICPQIYFSLDHPILPFRTCVNKWLNIKRDSSIKIYFGLAAYKAGSTNADSGTWSSRTDILKTEAEYVKGKCDGFMIFDYQNLTSTDEKRRKEVENLMQII